MATVDATATSTQVKFHLSLNVSNLGRSVAFYRTLFGLEPAKLHHDYAKFELVEPPVVMSLIPASQPSGGALNHMGVRLADSAALVDVQARLEAAGIATQREEGVECCYSRQTKFWVADPDRNLWELYILHEDIDEHGHEHALPEHLRDAPGIAASAAPAAASESKEPALWQHFLSMPLSERIPSDDAGLDEVRLEGTFNMLVESGRMQAFLKEVRRVLRPGGQVLVHGLVADRRFPGEKPQLPGPAAVVDYVPLEAEPMEALVKAGFIHVQFTKLAERPSFAMEGVEMRELKLAGVQPEACQSAAKRALMYLGPLSQVTDDEGNVFPRGQRVQIGQHAWSALRSGQAAEEFLFFPMGPSLPLACCS